MKKIFNDSIIGSANRGKIDTLFETLEEIQIYCSNEAYIGCNILKCELFTPKQDKILGYVLAESYLEKHILFLAVYEMEKNSFRIINDKREKVIKILTDMGMHHRAITAGIESCDKAQVSYINAFIFASINVHFKLPLDANESFIYKYLEIMKT